MEKVITIYDFIEMEVVGLLVINEIELGYLDSKIIGFGNDTIKSFIFRLLSTLDKTCVNTRDFNKSIALLPKCDKDAHNLHFLESFELKSKNKNKSSRYNRMLEHMNLSHLERFDYNYART